MRDFERTISDLILKISSTSMFTHDVWRSVDIDLDGSSMDEVMIATWDVVYAVTFGVTKDAIEQSIDEAIK